MVYNIICEYTEKLSNGEIFDIKFIEHKSYSPFFVEETKNALIIYQVYSNGYMKITNVIDRFISNDGDYSDCNRYNASIIIDLNYKGNGFDNNFYNKFKSILIEELRNEKLSKLL